MEACSIFIRRRGTVMIRSVMKSWTSTPVVLSAILTLLIANSLLPQSAAAPLDPTAPSEERETPSSQPRDENADTDKNDQSDGQPALERLPRSVVPLPGTAQRGRILQDRPVAITSSRLRRCGQSGSGRRAGSVTSAGNPVPASGHARCRRTRAKPRMFRLCTGRARTPC